MLWTRVSIPQRLRAPSALGHVFQAGGVHWVRQVRNSHIVAPRVDARQQHARNEVALAFLGCIALFIFPALGMVNAQAHATGLAEQLHNLIQAKKLRADVVAFGNTNGQFTVPISVLHGLRFVGAEEAPDIFGENTHDKTGLD